MKRFLKFTILSMTILLSVQLCAIDAIITLFVQKYPYFKNSKNNSNSKSKFDSQKYSKKLKQPDYVYRKITSNHHHAYNEIPGVMCLYQGRVALSTPQGQITFPRLQQSPNMHILISKGIKPAYIVAPATIYEWMLDNKHPAEMYLMELKHDPKTTLSYYETSKVNLPSDNFIPKNTLIFISDPENMYVPLGATVVDYSPNIILPTIYIKRGFCFIYNSLYTLAIKQYFQETQTSVKQDVATIAQIQQIT